MKTFYEKGIMVLKCLRTTDLDDSTIVQSAKISRYLCTSEAAVTEANRRMLMFVQGVVRLCLRQNIPLRERELHVQTVARIHKELSKQVVSDVDKKYDIEDLTMERGTHRYGATRPAPRHLLRNVPQRVDCGYRCW